MLLENQQTVQETQIGWRLEDPSERAQLVQVLEAKKTDMENKEFMDSIEKHIEWNLWHALVQDVATPAYAAAITVCWDWRTTWVELMAKNKKDWEEIYWAQMKHEWIDPLSQHERLQVFGWYSGLLLGAMWSLNKKHLFSEDEIISIFEQFVQWIPKIYEHTDEHNKECKDDYCGCGHLNNLRSGIENWQNQFWVTNEIIKAHKEIVSKDNKVVVETLADNHEEKWIIIVAWSSHQSEWWESIYTINSNKKNEQYFIVNLDAAYIMLERIAKDIDNIQRQQWMRNWTFLNEKEIFETLKAGFHDQLKSTAWKLASHLFENNTVFISAQNWKLVISPKNMLEVASTLSSLDEKKK